MNKTDALTQTKSLIVAILQKMDNINKSQEKFIIHILLLFLSIRDRYNFLNFSRYGSYCEHSYRNQFSKHFDFLTFNSLLIQEKCTNHLVIAFDPSYIPKSGKQTENLGRYWSGVSGRALKGLEIGGIAAVDIENNTALSLDSVPTPSKTQLESMGKTLVDHYGDLLVERKDVLEKLAKYLVVDGYFSKEKFITQITTQTNLEVVCKLRNDANLKYLIKETPIKRAGRPKKFAGKVNLKNIDKSTFQFQYEDETCKVYTAIVWSVSMKRKIKVSYVEFWNKGKYTNRYAVLFSTDLKLDGKLIYTYYKARFQIEFLFRDAKQHTGLTHCQARSQQKSNFHYNASLTSINLAKSIHFLPIEKEKRGAFSMRNIKIENSNKISVDRIFSMLELDLTCEKIKKIYKEAIFFGKLAA